MSKTKQLDVTENIMGTMPEGKLLFRMAIPMILSVLVQSLYNLVDSIFVGQMGDNALTAISLATPIATILLSASFGVAIGVNAILSQKLGARDIEGARKTAGNGVFLEVIIWLIFAAFGAFGANAFLSFQTNVAEIQQMGTNYTAIISIFSIGLVIQTLAERLLASTGKTTGSMIILATGAIVNIILDPIMIFGYFGMPAMGIAGAAWATVIGQFAGGIIGMTLHYAWNKELRMNMASFMPKGELIRGILKVGVPSALTFALTSVISFVMNMILIGFTTVAPAVYIIYVRIQNFVLMPVMGIRNTVVSIVAYNYGAQKKERIKNTIRLSLVSSTVVMFVGTMLFEILPTQLLGIFNASEQMIQIGVPALRIVGIAFVLTGVWNIFCGVFQALGHSNKALLISIVQIVVTLGAALLYSLTGNLNLVWTAFPTAEVFMFVSAILLMRGVRADVIEMLPSEKETVISTKKYALAD
ncbi:Multi antimicrobial extrusion protein (Na(+)/drug antiporter), MATE family of MDR efflux pump [Lachnospiraceae bacterium TWA4]|nr:Multi antimicrobial extrusion protein (Na(+)/drug antiporter), MATE family of MDR efflux pump [Lachnospiraceae bacterium TWA4]